MAVGRLTLQTLTVAGVVVTPVAPTATDGDKFQNDGRVYLYVNNESGAPITATLTAPNTCNQGFTHDLAITVAAGVAKYIGPLSTTRFNDSAGDVKVTCSAVATVTVAAIQV